MGMMARCTSTFCLISAFWAPAAFPAEAQEPPRQVISANPFGLLLEFFNAEYERQVSGTGTMGLGGSFLSRDDDEYINADVFYRHYPSGTPMDGWTFGIKVGITSVSDAGTYFGFGFDSNWSWLLGAEEDFYVGLGFGLKRLVGDGSDDVDLEYIPTFRIINVGFAF